MRLRLLAALALVVVVSLGSALAADAAVTVYWPQGRETPNTRNRSDSSGHVTVQAVLSDTSVELTNWHSGLQFVLEHHLLETLSVKICNVKQAGYLAGFFEKAGEVVASFQTGPGDCAECGNCDAVIFLACDGTMRCDPPGIM